jgi:hypothetical protein
LDSYILTVLDSDIGRFNQYVKLLIQSLTARNQTTSDLLINLFKGYGAVSGEVFRAWLLRKQDDHKEGEEVTPDELMLAAKNEFNTMKEMGIWNAPTAEEKIIAFEAKFDSSVKSLNKKVWNASTAEEKIIAFEAKFDSPVKNRNKKVSFERKKGGGGGKNSTEKSMGRKDGDSKKDGDHPKKWQAPSRVTKGRPCTKATSGTGVERKRKENVRSGVPINPRSAKALPSWEQRGMPRTTIKETRSNWLRNSR